MCEPTYASTTTTTTTANNGSSESTGPPAAYEYRCDLIRIQRLDPQQAGYCRPHHFTLHRNYNTHYYILGFTASGPVGTISPAASTSPRK